MMVVMLVMVLVVMMVMVCGLVVVVCGVVLVVAEKGGGEVDSWRATEPGSNPSLPRGESYW